MIAEERMYGTIDQIDGVVYFKSKCVIAPLLLLLLLLHTHTHTHTHTHSHTHTHTTTVIYTRTTYLA